MARTDITDAVRRADAMSAGLGHKERHALIERLSRAVGGWWQWDDESGEEWACIYRAEELVAFVAMYSPLVLHERGLADQLEASSHGAVLVGVDDLAAPILKADTEVLLRAFNDGVLDDDFDASRFAAEDLWWATHF